MDDDLGKRNEVIGILRLPLSGLDLEFSQGLQHSCLILHGGHDQQRLRSGTVTVAPADAARLNLKISKLNQEVEDLKCSNKKESEMSQKTYAEYAKLRNQLIEERMERKIHSSGDDSDSPDYGELRERSFSRSAGSSPRTRRQATATARDSRSKADLAMLHHLQSEIAEKDAKIESLEKTVKEMEVSCPGIASKHHDSYWVT